ncbi:hypothetical protein FQZ97_1189470 [compost metagenome]
MAGIAQCLADLRIQLQGQADGEGGQRQATGAKQLQHAPHPSARAVFVHALDAEITLAHTRRTARQFVEIGFGLHIAVEDAGLRALLDVEHELHRHPRAARPAWMRRAASVANEITLAHQPSSKVVTPNTR